MENCYYVRGRLRPVPRERSEIRGYVSAMESASSLFGGKFTASYAHGCSSKSTFSDCIVSGKYTRVFCSNGGVFTMNLVYFHALYDVRGERVSGGLIERGWPWRVAFRFVDGQRRIGRSNGIKIPHANSVVRCGFVRRWFHRIVQLNASNNCTALSLSWEKLRDENGLHCYPSVAL